MRDQAFADLGDTDPPTAASTCHGARARRHDHRRSNDVVDRNDPTGPAVENIREVTGTVKVPCYMTDPDGAGGRRSRAIRGAS